MFKIKIGDTKVGLYKEDNNVYMDLELVKNDRVFRFKKIDLSNLVVEQEREKVDLLSDGKKIRSWEHNIVDYLRLPLLPDERGIVWTDAPLEVEITKKAIEELLGFRIKIKED